MNPLDNELIAPTPEEHAYHLGWCAFFEEHALTSNLYNSITEHDLFHQWQDGYTTAKSVHNIIDLAIYRN